MFRDFTLARRTPAIAASVQFGTPSIMRPTVSFFSLFTAVICAVGLLAGCAHGPSTESGFISLFNGKDLTGWGSKTNNVNGRTKSIDGRYEVKDGILVVNEVVTPRTFSQMWTTREFPTDFILRLDFRAGVKADSGIYLRDPQLQCRDYWRMGPYKELKKYRPQEWNQIEVVVHDNVAFATCNGEILEAAMKLPPTGPIGLEGDLGVMEYRNIRIKPLP
jgi:hypothetical protein